MPRALPHEERIAWVRLARTGGVGPRTFKKLIERFGTAARALQELPRVMAASGRAEPVRVCPREVAESELERLDELGGRLLLLADADYPARLAEIEDAPPALSILGDAAHLERPCVALVGARNASGNGRVFAHHMARELAGRGVMVVSGLARGIDTAAHQGALEAGLTTAVVASGVDIAYPPENAGLMAAIAEHGCVVSERPIGREPQARHFPRRNRIIAGLSVGVVVVEAAPKSGSLITARIASEQGREVMAVPGSPLDPRHRGTNQLLREGATLVESAADVMAVLAPQITSPRPAPAPRRRSPRPAAPRPAALPRPGARAQSGGDPLATRLFESLGAEPLLVDELIRQCHASSAEVQHALLELELEGRIERHPGNRVSLASS